MKERCKKGEMIEALTHDIGKASQGRFGGHAASSAEMLCEAGFEDDAVLRLVAGHHKPSSNDDLNLHLLQQILKREEDRGFLLIKSLESNQSIKKAHLGFPSGGKLKNAIVEMHSAGFSIDGIAYQTGLPELHIKEVLNGENSYSYEDARCRMQDTGCGMRDAGCRMQEGGEI